MSNWYENWTVASGRNRNRPAKGKGKGKGQGKGWGKDTGKGKGNGTGKSKGTGKDTGKGGEYWEKGYQGKGKGAWKGKGTGEGKGKGHEYWGGSPVKGQDLGKGSGKPQGKEAGKAPQKVEREYPRGTYIACAPGCGHFEYTDVAGAACVSCEKAWDWQAFRDDRRTFAAQNPGRTNHEDTAQGAPGAEEPASIEEAPVQEVPKKTNQQVVNAARSEVDAASKAFTKLQGRQSHEQRIQDGILQKINDLLVQVTVKKEAWLQQDEVVRKIIEEKVLASQMFTAKDAAATLATTTMHDTFAQNVKNTFAPVEGSAPIPEEVSSPGTNTAAAAGVAAAAPGLGTGAKPAGRKTWWADAEDVPTTGVGGERRSGPAPTINGYVDAAVDGFDAAVREMDEDVNRTDTDQDRDGSDDSDDEQMSTAAGSEAPDLESVELSEEGWKASVSHWAFHALANTQPDKELLDWFCEVWGDSDRGDTVQTVSNVMCTARDAYVAARIGWQDDMAKVGATAAAGNTAGAAQMEHDCNLYSQHRKESIQNQLDELLETGLSALWVQRRQDQESGKAKASSKKQYICKIPSHARKKGGGGLKAGGAAGGTAPGRKKGTKKPSKKDRAEDRRKEGTGPAAATKARKGEVEDKIQLVTVDGTTVADAVAESANSIIPLAVAPDAAAAHISA